MKLWKYIFCIVLVWSGIIEMREVNAGIPPKRLRLGNSNTSCAIPRGKSSASDLLEYRFGIVAGQNISNIKTDNESVMDIIPGVMAGVAAQIIWPMGFTIQPEILYSKKGSMFSGSGLRYKIDYVEIPVKVKYRLNVAFVKPFAFVAPYGAYALGLTEEGEVHGDDTFSNLVKKWDYGVGAGAGFDVWRIQLSFKYSWGFAQIIQETFTIRNKVFTLSAGVFF